MPTKSQVSSCKHVASVDGVTWEELHLKQKTLTACETCGVKATNLWLCLVGPCQYVGCGESHKDHSSLHAEHRSHSLTINLTTLRIWCYFCEVEVFPGRNTPSFVIPENSASLPIKQNSEQVTNTSGSMQNPGSVDSSPHKSLSGVDDSDTDPDDESVKPRGLTGLQNLGNTCYLNSAIQSLSNCPPLTRFFVDCGAFVRPEKTPMLSKNYMKLINDIWHKKRPSYVVPSGVVNGIKVVHPMFRGYSQQDAQEFLRCFMDQIHEELKQPIPQSDDEAEENAEEIQMPIQNYVNGHHRRLSESNSSSSQSDDFYETCDSGLSSDRGSADINITDDNESNKNVRSESPQAVSTVSDGKTYKRLRTRSETDSGAGDSIVSAKERKDSTNTKLCQKVASKLKDSTDRDNNTEDVENTRSRNTASPRQKRVSESSQTIKKSQFSPKTSVRRRAQKKNVQYQSVISDIFDGKILSSVQCLTCERISTTKETFQDLSLPIPTKDHLHMIHSSSQGGPPKGGTCGEVRQGWFSWMFGWMRSWFVGPLITLQDCLAAFFSADELKGDNMYSCEKCKKLRNGIKYSRVLELPEILCIHLKRFRHEFYSSKISTYVSFPLDSLDMKTYLHKDCTSEVTLYDLVAVICHHGTAGGGHYTAYCLNYINEQWYEFDDQYVTEVDISQVINCEAYVLFYRKRNDAMVTMRQKAMQLMEAREPSLMQFFVSKQWINRFNTFAEPGPISNHDFLCNHGGVPPHRVNDVENLVVAFNQDLWDFLYQRFGGGPVCNHLYPCNTCQKELDKLRHRQKTEMEHFVELNEKFRDEDSPSAIYAISMAWFKEWESFVRGKTNSPPGPIENQRICFTKNGQSVMRQNSDHGQLSADMWHYLFGIYGGGPELLTKQMPVSQTLAAAAASAKRSSSPEAVQTPPSVSSRGSSPQQTTTASDASEKSTSSGTVTEASKDDDSETMEAETTVTEEQLEEESNTDSSQGSDTVSLGDVAIDSAAPQQESPKAEGSDDQQEQQESSSADNSKKPVKLHTD